MLFFRCSYAGILFAFCKDSANDIKQYGEQLHLVIGVNRLYLVFPVLCLGCMLLVTILFVRSQRLHISLKSQYLQCWFTAVWVNGISGLNISARTF